MRDDGNPSKLVDYLTDIAEHYIGLPADLEKTKATVHALFGWHDWILKVPPS